MLFHGAPDAVAVAAAKHRASDTAHTSGCAWGLILPAFPAAVNVLHIFPARRWNHGATGPSFGILLSSRVCLAVGAPGMR